MRNIDALHPDIREKVYELENRCRISGLKIGIGECLRTMAEQDALYAKGRTAPGNIVTNARGSTFSSMHQWGVAFDFFRNDGLGAYNTADGFFEKVGAIGKEIGLMWGGDFKSIKDMPHFQLPDWGSGPAKLKRIYGTPEEFFKTWEDAMTKEERDKFNMLVEQVDKLTKESERIYHYTVELPSWARATIQKLLDKGLYAGASEGDLNLPESLMRNLVINDRAGLYG